MQARDSSAGVRVAAIAPNWLGDAVMCLPSLSLLARAHGAALSVLSNPYVARVFLHQSGVDDLHVDPAGGRSRRIAARARALRVIGPRVAVMFPPSFSSALPALLAGVPRRTGFSADGRSALLTRALPTPSRAVHLVDSYLDLGRASLQAAELEPENAVRARLVVTDNERAAVKRRLAGVTGAGYMVVVPGAAFGPAKTWPEERYRALCRTLVRDTPVILTGSSGDRATCQRIARDVPGVLSLAGETSLGEMFALVEGAHALVANDSGAPHVAAALDVPCVVLFGSTAPAWTAPRGGDVRILQHKVHCNPCFRRTCPTELECFNGIAVEDVVEAVRGIPGGQKKADAPGKPLG